MAPRLIILGWDSATFDVTTPLLEQGRLPHLAALLERGFRAPLRSTWPPMTDCAWTSAFTGVNPGSHGIFGSWYRAPGSYACRYFSSRDRRAPALWDLAPGIRFLVFNVPMTFPPVPVDGAIVAGYGAPPGSRFCAPAHLQDALAERWPLDDLLDRAPHGSLETFLADLLRGLEVQPAAIRWLTGEAEADCAVVVWPHIDRAQHFFWRFRNTAHPLAGAVEKVYEAMDAATGKVVSAFPDADVLVVSDHGAGALKGDVNLGAWLVREGLAAYGDRKRSPLVELAWMLPPALRRLGRRLTPTLARRAFGATLAGQLGPFDWSRTKAFVGFHGDLWLNLEGREPRGKVAASDAPSLVEELRERLASLREPHDGAHIFSGVHARDEIYSGASLHLAPDLVLDSWSAGYRVAPNREDSDIVVPPQPLAGVRESWSSDHRPLGIFVAAGPSVRAGEAAELSIYDVCPTALALLGAPIAEGLDGRVATEALTPAFLEAKPVKSGPAAPAPAAARDSAEEAARGYSEEEAAAVAAHLKDLGYIE